jgi:hypothetical protein
VEKCRELYRALPDFPNELFDSEPKLLNSNEQMETWQINHMGGGGLDYFKYDVTFVVGPDSGLFEPTVMGHVTCYYEEVMTDTLKEFKREMALQCHNVYGNLLYDFTPEKLTKLCEFLTSIDVNYGWIAQAIEAEHLLSVVNILECDFRLRKEAYSHYQVSLVYIKEKEAENETPREPAA